MSGKTMEVASAGDMRRLIKLAEKAKNSMVEVNMGRLERESIQMEVYSDELFGCGRGKISDLLYNGLWDGRGVLWRGNQR